MSLLTDRKIQALELRDKKYTVTESGERGESRLQVNVYPSGVKKFQIQYFLNKTRKRLEFGKYGKALGFYSLSQARVKFSELAELVKQAVDPKSTKGVPGQNGDATLGDLKVEFLVWYKAKWKKSSYDSVDAHLERYYEKNVDQLTPVSQVKVEDIQRCIYGVWNENSKSAANALKNAMSAMFKYALEYDNTPERFGKKPKYNLEYNPCSKVFLHYKATPGKRYLSEGEIKSLWHVSNMSLELHNYIKLSMVLGGQRIDEVSLSNDKEFNLNEKIFEIPAERVKISGRGSHIVPLSDFGLSVYKEIRRHRNKNGFVIADGDRNQKSLGGSLRWWFEKNPDFEKFTLRDLRRTCKTLMTKAGVTIEHRDMLQQHHKSDVATVHYDRYNYLREKRIAMDVWNNYLQEIVKK